MKKYLLIFTFIIFFLAPSVQAKTLKVLAIENFSTAVPKPVCKILIVDSQELIEGVYLKAGTIVSGNVIEIHKPNIGKRDSYFEIIPTSITYNGITEDITHTPVICKVQKYKHVEVKELAAKTGLSVANIILKGMIDVLEFAHGAYQDNYDNRIKSGIMEVYNSSFLKYIEPGSELNISRGDLLVLKVKKIRWL